MLTLQSMPNMRLIDFEAVAPGDDIRLRPFQASKLTPRFVARIALELECKRELLRVPTLSRLAVLLQALLIAVYVLLASIVVKFGRESCK
jgi:hypothetical protein